MCVRLQPMMKWWQRQQPPADGKVSGACIRDGRDSHCTVREASRRTERYLAFFKYIFNEREQLRNLLLLPHYCSPLRTITTTSQEFAAASEGRLSTLQTGVTFKDCERYLFPLEICTEFKGPVMIPHTTEWLEPHCKTDLRFQKLHLISNLSHCDVLI